MRDMNKILVNLIFNLEESDVIFFAEFPLAIKEFRGFHEWMIDGIFPF